jgi:hypothetical protein
MTLYAVFKEIQLPIFCFFVLFCISYFQCKKKHILDCEEFSLTGKCSKGKKCNLMHRRRAKKRRRKSSAKETKPQAKRPTLEQMTEEEGFLALEQIDGE